MSALLNILYSIITFLLDLLPAFTGLPSGLSSAVVTAGSYIAGIVAFFPATTLFQIALLEIGIELAILLFHFLAWVFHWRQVKA